MKYPKLLCILFGLLLINPGAYADNGIVLEVYKSKRLMLVKKDHDLKRTFKIATGSGGSGNKKKNGDNITPTGAYRIVHFKEDSRFHYFMQINYPNARDIVNGLKRSQIDRDQYNQMIYHLKRKEAPDQKTMLGGAIGIHGISEEDEEKLKLHQDENWTQGCIAMTNEEIDELRKFVHIGTPIIIFD